MRYRLGIGGDSDPENGKFFTYCIDGGLLAPKDKDEGGKNNDQNHDDYPFKGELPQCFSD